MSTPLGVLATFVSITMATVGIVNSFVLSRFNERSSERKARLQRQFEELQTRVLRLPKNLVKQSVETLADEIGRIRILKTTSIDLFLGFLSLAFFLPSFFIFYFIDYGGTVVKGIQIDASMPTSLAHFFFLLGVLLLIPYMISLGRLLWAFLRFYTPKKCWGALKWADPEHEEKIITKSFSGEEILRVAVRFNGFAANGFIDTLLTYTDGVRDYQIWVPDKLTYLSPTSYDIYGILHRNPDLDTGTLQGRLNQVFSLEFRVGESSHRPPVRDYLWRGVGDDVFGDYYIPEKMQVKELRIRMYVDPLFSPRLERHYLDELVVRNSDTH